MPNYRSVINMAGARFAIAVRKHLSAVWGFVSIDAFVVRLAINKGGGR